MAAPSAAVSRRISGMFRPPEVRLELLFPAALSTMEKIFRRLGDAHSAPRLLAGPKYSQPFVCPPLGGRPTHRASRYGSTVEKLRSGDGNFQLDSSMNDRSLPK